MTVVANNLLEKLTAAVDENGNEDDMPAKIGESQQPILAFDY